MVFIPKGNSNVSQLFLVALVKINPACFWMILNGLERLLVKIAREKNCLFCLFTFSDNFWSIKLFKNISSEKFSINANGIFSKFDSFRPWSIRDFGNIWLRFTKISQVVVLENTKNISSSNFQQNSNQMINSQNCSQYDCTKIYKKKTWVGQTEWHLIWLISYVL